MGLLDSFVSTNNGGGLLGQSFDDPRSAAIMALAGGLLQKNLAGGLLGANNAYAQAKQAATQAEFQKMQMDNMREELALKKLQASRKDEGMAMLQRLLGGGSALDYKPGQLGSGSFGAAPNADPMAPPVRRPGGLANATPEQIAMAKVYGYDLTEPWKVANQGFEFKPNSFRLDPNTKAREYIPDVKEGVQYQNGVASNIPGYLEMQTQRTLATEAPKALLNAAGRVNMRPGADGKEYPVAELSENPVLQQVLGNLFSGRGAMPQSVAPNRTPSSAVPPAGPTVIAPDAQRAADQDAMKIIRSELASATDPKVRAGLERELARFEAAQSRPGFPTSTAAVSAAPTPSQGYGKTTEQKIADKAAEERAVGTAKNEVVTESTRLKDVQTANKFLRIAGQAQDILRFGNPTQSGAGRLADSAMGFIGKSTESGDQAQRLKALGGWLVANVPRMEGPQSNFDVANYQVMAADVGNDALPLSRRQAALESIIGMFNGVISGNVKPESQGSGTGKFSIKRIN